jgi:hypothetical protein
MTTTVFGVGEVVRYVWPTVVTLEAKTHTDFELEDGTILLNVPLAAIYYEPEWETAEA